MNLAAQIKDLNDQAAEIVAMMRQSAEVRRQEEARVTSPAPWRNSEPRRVTAANLFLSTPGGLDILRDEFKVVPERFYETVGEQRRITCPCGFASHLLDLGALHECEGCGRFYYAGRVLRASSAEEQQQAA